MHRDLHPLGGGTAESPQPPAGGEGDQTPLAVLWILFVCNMEGCVFFITTSVTLCT